MMKNNYILLAVSCYLLQYCKTVDNIL